MKVAFRCDASIEIGLGHVMRCLTLARALRGAGAICQFISRAHPGHLGERIAAEGFQATLLPAGHGPVPATPPAHAHWAGVDWARDAEETRSILDANTPDWLVVDHYAFDARWERTACPQSTRVMVIDDLADRPHACDELLDQNLGREAGDYDGLVPDHCTPLIGPQYALLRPEFAEMRSAALAARYGRRLCHLLISMGGTDASDATSRILDALAGAVAVLTSELHLSIIMGANAPALARVRAKAQALPWTADVIVDVTDMAERMSAADLAIGAAGSTSWERCCLGLPSIVVEIAANQSGIARALVAAGAALDPGALHAPHFDKRLIAALIDGCNQLADISKAAAEICDGDGVERVLNKLMVGALSFRDATGSDSRRIWEWRKASGLEKFSLSARAPNFQDHNHWFMSALQNPQRFFRVLMQGGLPCGYLRLDLDGSDRARVSLCLAPQARGQGLADSLLEEATRLGLALGLSHLDAEIHPENTASLRCFERAGYNFSGNLGGFQKCSMKLGERL